MCWLGHYSGLRKLSLDCRVIGPQKEISRIPSVGQGDKFAYCLPQRPNVGRPAREELHWIFCSSRELDWVASSSPSSPLGGDSRLADAYSFWKT